MEAVSEDALSPLREESSQCREFARASPPVRICMSEVRCPVARNMFAPRAAGVLLAAVCVLFAECVWSQLDGYTPDVDYPIYNEVPKGLSFKCSDHIPGYYSDPEARCQVWHWCLPNGRQYSFLCPNGTVFNQYARVCDWWFNVDCQATPNLYNINEDLYKIPQKQTKQ